MYKLFLTFIKITINIRCFGKFSLFFSLIIQIQLQQFKYSTFTILQSNLRTFLQKSSNLTTILIRLERVLTSALNSLSSQILSCSLVSTKHRILVNNDASHVVWVHLSLELVDWHFRHGIDHFFPEPVTIIIKL